ncbi:MAG: hypothetical protein AAGD96_10315 [Chloroflexota bacterium]
MTLQISKDHNGDYQLGSDRPELITALHAIARWHNLDELVTFALRRVGYGGDYFGITYELDVSEGGPLPDGYLETYSFTQDDLLILEQEYLNLLLQVCQLEGLTERADLLSRFITDPSIAADLPEADPEFAMQQWKQLIPYLEERGWQWKDEMLEDPDWGMRFRAGSYQKDVGVQYRWAKRVIAAEAQKDQPNVPMLHAYRSIVESIEACFGSLD